jgi:hypothetical protein
VNGVFCNQCGHRNPAGSNFCSSCGAVLDVDGDEHTITFAAPEPEAEDDLTVQYRDVAPDKGLLLVKRGPNAGTTYELGADVVRAGRHPASDIFLDDITVSRRHAEFVRGPAGWTMRDVGSLNGTYLNRERTDEAVLSNGDEVQIGKFKLVYLAGTAEA